MLYLDLEVVVGDEEVNGFGVALDTFGKRVAAAYDPAQACSQGAKPAFHVVGLAFFLAAAAVRSTRKGDGVGVLEVAAGGAAGVILGNGLA